MEHQQHQGPFNGERPHDQIIELDSPGGRIGCLITNEQSTALLVEDSNASALNLGADLYSGVFANPTTTTFAGNDNQKGKMEATTGGVNSDPSKQQNKQVALRVTARVTTKHKNCDLKQHVKQESKHLAKKSQHLTIDNQRECTTAAQKQVRANHGRPNSSSDEQFGSTQRRRNESSPPSLSASRHQPAAKSPFTLTSAAQKKRRENQKNGLPLCSQIGKLNGSVASFHQRQELRESDQKQFEELVELAMKEQMTGYGQRPQQQTADVEGIPKLTDLAYGQRTLSQADFQKSADATSNNDDLYADFNEFNAYHKLTKVADPSNILKPFKTLTEHQMEKLDALKAAKSKRMFSTKHHQFQDVKKDMSHVKQSKFLSRKVSSQRMTPSDATYGTQQFKHQMASKLTGSDEEVEWQWIQQATKLGTFGAVSPLPAPPSSHHPKKSKLVGNLTSALQFTKMPISDNNMKKYKEAASANPLRDSTNKKYLRLKGVNRPDTIATGAAAPSSCQTRILTPSRESLSNNTDLQEVQPQVSPVAIVGSAVAINQKQQQQQQQHLNDSVIFKQDQQQPATREITNMVSRGISAQTGRLGRELSHASSIVTIMERGTNPQTPVERCASSVPVKPTITTRNNRSSYLNHRSSGRLVTGITQQNTVQGTMPAKPTLAASGKTFATKSQKLSLITSGSAATKAPPASSGFSQQPHYKLGRRQESYSQKGFGNGFASKGDRFTGVNEAQFQVITWFKNLAVQEGNPATVSASSSVSKKYPNLQQARTGGMSKQDSLRMLQMEDQSKISKRSSYKEQNSVNASERMTQKLLKQQSRYSEANNVQEVIKVNKDQMRSGQYIGRCLQSHLPFPHDIIHEERHSKQLKKQRQIPKHYQSMSSGFKSQAPRLLAGVDKGTNLHGRLKKELVVPGPGHYDIDAGQNLTKTSAFKSRSLRLNVKAPIQERNPTANSSMLGRNHYCSVAIEAADTEGMYHHLGSALTSAHASLVDIGSNSLLHENNQGTLGINGTACKSQSHFNITQTWNMEQWKSNFQPPDSASRSKSPSRKDSCVEVISQRPSQITTRRTLQKVHKSQSIDSQDVPVAPAPPVFVKNFSSNKNNHHQVQVAQISSAQAELVHRADLSRGQKHKILQIVNSGSKTGTTTAPSSSFHQLEFQSQRATLAPATHKQLHEDPFSISSCLKQKVRRSVGGGAPKQVAGFCSSQRPSAATLRPQSLHPAGQLLSSAHSVKCLQIADAHPMTMSQTNFKKTTVLENSTRILLCNRPGKKKKKRKLAQDVAIWQQSSAQAPPPDAISSQNAYSCLKPSEQQQQQQIMMDQVPLTALAAATDTKKLSLQQHSGKKMTNFILRQHKQALLGHLQHQNLQQDATTQQTTMYASSNNIGDMMMSREGFCKIHHHQHQQQQPYSLREGDGGDEEQQQNITDLILPQRTPQQQQQQPEDSLQKSDQNHHQQQQRQEEEASIDAYQQILLQQNTLAAAATSGASRRQSAAAAAVVVVEGGNQSENKKALLLITSKNRADEGEEQVVAQPPSSLQTQGKQSQKQKQGQLATDAVTVDQLDQEQEQAQQQQQFLKVLEAQLETSGEEQSTLLQTMRGGEIIVCQLDDQSSAVDGIDSGGGDAIQSQTNAAAH